MPLRVMIVDDHAVFRQGLRLLLQSQPDVEVVAEACDGREAIDLGNRLRPDVVVMDISMPNLNGIDAARQIRDAVPEAKVVALSALGDRRLVTEALRAGVAAYVLKASTTEELVRAIRTAMAGETYLSPPIAQVVVADYAGGDRRAANGVARLSPREREVLQLLAEGKATKEVAALLHLSVKTVETHRRAVMEKLNLFSIAELTKHAIREGLTPLEA